jgi:hypothetical protein
MGHNNQFVMDQGQAPFVLSSPFLIVNRDNFSLSDLSFAQSFQGTEPLAP